ncbi:oxygenase [Lithospermum erythrorhizon]|uniref:Oxygenase n=1 Tax=Lithospermum erythrorhizon TaxID=34254 RepID=A0AAV3QRN1_LITER
MEAPTLFLIILVATMIMILKFKKKSNSDNKLPPGPPGRTIFGNLFDLGSMPHRTLANLKQKYGPVVWLRLGAKNTIVLLNAKSAAELFKNHDLVFVDRFLNEVMKSHDFHKGSIALSPYGPFWRSMKRVMTVQMLVNKKINETTIVRRKCVDDMLMWIEKEANQDKTSSGGIHVARFVFLASFNMLGNLLLSRDLVDPESTEGSEFFSTMLKLMEWSGHPNVADLFPWLKWLDPQGLKRRMNRDLSVALNIVAEFVKERKQSGLKKIDFLEVLLEFEGNGVDEPAKISDHNLNLLILETFLAGSETTSGTIEWAMVELLSKPETMINVKTELNDIVGPRKFEENDIDKCKYLQSVLKETLRLHPPIPFLVPRRAVKDTNFMSYNIPKDTQLFVNVWAIGRDPEHWEEPFSFKPERFIDSKVDYKGQHFELLPFGAGRRICAGIPLAHRMLHLVLGSMLHEFDWEVQDLEASGITDNRERLGVTVRKIVPLKAIPKKVRSII